MIEQLRPIIYFSIVFLSLFASAELMYRLVKVKAELTRKYVHVVTGLITLLFPVYIDNHWSVLFLCASFLVILIASLFFNFLPSINNVERQTRGSILFPITVYICYLVAHSFEDYSLFYLPILILAIPDPLAAIMGKKIPYGTFNVFGSFKTITGSATFFASAYFLSVLYMLKASNDNLAEVLILSLWVALSSTIVEAVSHKGYDNITIPLIVILILLFNLNFL